MLRHGRLRFARISAEFFVAFIVPYVRPVRRETKRERMRQARNEKQEQTGPKKELYARGNRKLTP